MLTNEVFVYAQYSTNYYGPKKSIHSLYKQS